MNDKYILIESLLNSSNRIVIIKGNPKWAQYAEKDLYPKLKAFLEKHGYTVDFDLGKPHTTPKGKAYAWIGHSRGADRLRFAPKHIKTIAIGSSLPDSINHPKDVTNLKSPEDFDKLPDHVKKAHNSWHNSFADKLLKQLEYREEKDSTVTHDNKRYSVNKLLDIVKHKPTTTVNVDDLKWILKYTKLDKERVRKANIKHPIIITKWKSKWVILDGAHRLQKAVNTNTTHLQAKEVHSDELNKALVKN
jgi:hypothetical protein